MPAKRGKNSNLAEGKRGEDVAAEFLIRRGCRILKRNYSRAHAEIDLIALDGDTVVFVEVKTRHSQGFGGPVAAVNRVKQQHLVRAARCFVAENQYDGLSFRFDVIAVTEGASGDAAIRHFAGAFLLPV
ncbi:MAG: YraN family protein [Planctomycetota bacterium]